MRLFPPVPSIGRQLAEDRNFDGYMLRKGTWVYTHIYSIHHHPDIWENPEVLTCYVYLDFGAS